MQFFYWLVLLIAVGIAIFALQNSSAPLITVKFLVWSFETSLIYTLLGSAGVGILMILFLWIPRAIRASLKLRELKKKIENLEKMVYGPSPSIEKTGTHKEP
ncbi:MAG: LapA family protein [Thermodesulfobacteriota bacterium]